MAQFGTVQLPDWTKTNDLFDNAKIAQDYALARIATNRADTGEQDLSDRATLRGLAGGFTARDPAAFGTAASLPIGVAPINALSNMDAQTAASKLNLMQYQNGLISFPETGPQTPVSPLGTSAPAAGDDQFINQLGGSESGNRPGVVNSEGYNGGYQFGAPRLSDLGVYTPAPGEIGQGGKWNNKTEGTFNIPGHPEVKTVADFLKNGEAQRAVMHLQVNDLRNVIQQTPGAENFNPTGLLAVGHLGGPTGMARFIQTNGAYNPKDSNGTSLMDYYKRFSQEGPAGLQQAYGHPGGPLPDTHPVHQQLASLNGTAGMPAVATDAQPAATAPASMADVQTLLNSYRQAQVPADQQVAVDPSYLANRNAPVPDQPAPVAPTAAAPQADLVTPPAPAPQAVPAQAAPTVTPQATPAAQPANRMDSPPPGTVYAKTGPGGAEFVTKGMPAGYALARFPDGTTGAARLPGMPPQITMKQVGDYMVSYDPAGNEVKRVLAPQTISRVTTHNPDGSETHYSSGGAPMITSAPNTRDIQVKDYESDRKEADTLADAGRQAQSSQIRLQHMMELVDQLKTGANGGTRAQWANLAQTYLPTDWAKKFNPVGEGGAAAAQEFEKLATQSAGQQERSVMGARGGIQAINLFKSANPGLELQPDANRRILIVQRIGAQADSDYAQGAVEHYNQHADAFRSGKGQYVPLTKFDQQWNAQRNPQIYAAAMDAANGADWSKWTHDLKTQSPADVQRVIEIVRKAVPNAQIKWKDGTLHSVGVPQ